MDLVAKVVISQTAHQQKYPQSETSVLVFVLLLKEVEVDLCRIPATKVTIKHQRGLTLAFAFNW